MPKIPVSKLEPGMTLAKPVATKSGMVMLGEGTQLTAKWIERIQDIGIAHAFVEGPSAQVLSKEEALDNLNLRFSHVAGKPYMNVIKKIVKEHIEGLYE
ncbi:MAG: hypothetical protein A3J88_03675 [Melioribacter sp. RIFOXYB12_FULL_38_5]|nr:MAG: hypothetical protein A3J88_03675 [Melioribacter sp. RIFOXYB12_FULL_38_5]